MARGICRERSKETEKTVLRASRPASRLTAVFEVVSSCEARDGALSSSLHKTALPYLACCCTTVPLLHHHCLPRTAAASALQWERQIDSASEASSPPWKTWILQYQPKSQPQSCTSSFFRLALGDQPREAAAVITPATTAEFRYLSVDTLAVDTLEEEAFGLASETEPPELPADRSGKVIIFSAIVGKEEEYREFGVGGVFEQLVDASGGINGGGSVDGGLVCEEAERFTDLRRHVEIVAAGVEGTWEDAETFFVHLGLLNGAGSIGIEDVVGSVWRENEQSKLASAARARLVRHSVSWALGCSSQLHL
ncbi:uncharacterized protein LOC126600954 [Malus sylvestris]|uniref:uncharacterized protein LOC126600954 n=1 Tax=Malus sylvestris TaxID=3752 RepID=UPI0021AD3B09|nr:uncharacterized protein LOC126600954 [Malus sylvestris]